MYCSRTCLKSKAKKTYFFHSAKHAARKQNQSVKAYHALNKAQDDKDRMHLLRFFFRKSAMVAQRTASEQLTISETELVVEESIAAYIDALIKTVSSVIPLR